MQAFQKITTPDFYHWHRVIHIKHPIKLFFPLTGLPPKVKVTLKRTHGEWNGSDGKWAASPEHLN
jgi:hypothetical protein